MLHAASCRGSACLRERVWWRLGFYAFMCPWSIWMYAHKQALWRFSAEPSRTANLQRVAASLASYFLQAHSIYNAVFGTEDAQRMGRQGWGRLFLIKIKRFILCYGLFLHTHGARGSVWGEISHCVVHINFWSRSPHICLPLKRLFQRLLT